MNSPLSQSRLLLAPMEGVADWVMRDTLTQIGGIDQCVTEFLRVTDKLHPHSVFYKNCPELRTQSRTRHGTPVFVQLLGGQAEPLAVNAKRAYDLGALGIDLNFGCPAKTVNRHDGGATLLKCPDRLFNIIKTVRAAVPSETPVTAKIRLGFEDPSACLENAKAAEEAGATWLTIHCRTKTNGYKPPAFWEWIPRVQEVTKIRIIANGDIWGYKELKECHRITGCSDFMMGRAILSNPFVFKETKEALQNETLQKSDSLELNWQNTKSLLPSFFQASTDYINEHFATARTKQWLRGLSMKSIEAKSIFDEIKVLHKPHEFRSRLEYHCQ